MSDGEEGLDEVIRESRSSGQSYLVDPQLHTVFVELQMCSARRLHPYLPVILFPHIAMTLRRRLQAGDIRVPPVMMFHRVRVEEKMQEVDLLGCVSRMLE
jgi:hypothetical protein